MAFSNYRYLCVAFAVLSLSYAAAARINVGGEAAAHVPAARAALAMDSKDFSVRQATDCNDFFVTLRVRQVITHFITLKNGKCVYCSATCNPVCNINRNNCMTPERSAAIRDDFVRRLGLGA